MATPEAPCTITQYLPLLGVVVGGLLTFAGGYVGTVRTEQRRQSREAKTLARAFRGELMAIRQIVVHRRYLEDIAETIEYIKTTNKPWTYNVRVKREYFGVFEKNVDKISTLALPLPELIVSFYIRAKAVLEDFERFRDGEFSTEPKIQLKAYEQFLALAHDTLRIADEIVEQISKLYP